MTKLRVGIVGLARRWRKRYRPALRALLNQFAIRAVWDSLPQRAQREARRLGCQAAAGVVEMLEREDIDAVLLVNEAWHGLWPLEAACPFGKPVFCAVPLAADAQHADAVCQKVSQAQLPVMTAPWPRFAPASLRLQQLLQEQLGTPRLLLCEQRGPKPGRIRAELLDWCMVVFGAAPLRVKARGRESDLIEEVFADFGQERAARISRWTGRHTRHRVRLHVVAERGTACVDLPNRLRWDDSDGRHAFTATGQMSAAEGLLERFHEAVTLGRTMQPSLEDARQAWTWLRSGVT
jgi:predicted dehydrogenase